MTALSELQPAGGGQGEVKFVASGTISNGAAVVLNSNGTVSPVAQVAQNIPLGSEATFNSAAIDSCVVRFILTDPNKFVLAYRLQSNSYGYVVVGTISGTSISFGTAVAFKSAATQLSYTLEMCHLTANRFLVCYAYGSGYTKGQCVSGDISGTSITINAPSQDFTQVHPSPWGAGDPKNMDLALDPNSTSSDKFMVGWMLFNPSKQCHYRAGSINADGSIWFSGLTLDPRFPGSIGYNVYGKWPTVTFDSKNEGYGVLTWTVDGNNSANRKSWARPFFWGYTVALGPAIEYTTYGSFNTTYSPVIKANPFVGGQYVIAFGMEFNGPFFGAAVVLNVTNVTGGGSNPAGSSIAASPQAMFDANAYGTYPPNGGGSHERTVSLIFSRTQPNVFVIAWSASSTSVKIRRGTITPVTGEIIFTAESTSDSGSNEWVSVDMPISGDISIVCYQDLTNSQIGKVRLGQVLVDNVTDVIGLAGSAISDTATGPVNVFGGVNTQQSSLTIGTEYYVQPNGTITSAKVYPAQRLGRAVTATTINMRDLT